jgi:hypothetical protein
MFNESTGVEPVLMLEGIERRTLTYGENMLLVEFTVRAGDSAKINNRLDELNTSKVV